MRRASASSSFCNGSPAQFAQAAQERAADCRSFCRDLAIGAAGSPGGAARNSLTAFRSARRRRSAATQPKLGTAAANPLDIEKDGGADFATAARQHASRRRCASIRHGLARLFVIQTASQAPAHLAYPLGRMAQLALESRRAECIVVGEDLGAAWGFAANEPPMC
jgi:glycogen operon protein